jgi:HAD superfamily hydrolase (TIGR01509 family)
MEHIDIKGIIFDYGGTIDTHGIHWSEVIWDGYQSAGIKVTKDVFREAYVYAELELARVRHIMPKDNFLVLLQKKMMIEFGYLASKNIIDLDFVDMFAQQVARYCYMRARKSVDEARPVLEALSKRFPMVLVTNFYGNVDSVLTDFSLKRYFISVIESAVVGIRKPDPRIFQLGVDALHLQPADVLVVGDSYRKDIVPAESIGCHVLWLKGKGWTAEEDAQMHPCIIQNLNEVTDLAL